MKIVDGKYFVDNSGCLVNIKADKKVKFNNIDDLA